MSIYKLQEKKNVFDLKEYQQHLKNNHNRPETFVNAEAFCHDKFELNKTQQKDLSWKIFKLYFLISTRK